MSDVVTLNSLRLLTPNSSSIALPNSKYAFSNTYGKHTYWGPDELPTVTD